MVDIQNRSKRTSKALADGSKRGKCLYVFKKSIVSCAEEKKQVIVVHRKRKFEEISNALAKEQLNKSYVYHSSNALNRSNIQEVATDQNKRNSALTVLHQDEDFHSLTDSFERKLQLENFKHKPLTFKVNSATYSLENLNVKPMTTELLREDLTEVLIQSQVMQQLMTQRTTDEQMSELRRDFDRFEYIQHYLSAKARNAIDVEDKEQQQQFICSSLESGISSQVIDQYIAKLNQGQYSYIFDTITSEALANMENERFIQYLEKRGINHLGKSMILVFPVFDSESRTFSLYISAHNILTVENENNPTCSEKLLSLLSS